MGKRMNKILLVVLLGMFVVLYGTDIHARAISNEVSSIGLPKMAAGKVTQTMSNIGNWGFWANYNGQTGHDPFTGSSGGYYPRGTAAAIYMDGIIWGGYMGTKEKDNLRVGGIGYRIGTVPGWIDDSGQPVDSDNDRVRIYRIRSDWATLTEAQVSKDAAELNNVGEADVTSAMALDMIAQYKADWMDWPVDLGAPWVDADGDGVYNMDAGDTPGIANADQVIWWVVNDMNEGKVNAHSGVAPIGLELQITLWGYNQPGAGLGQIVFKKYKIINKSGMTIDSMFVAQYSDPDVGAYGDDVVGCDVEKSLHYAYNGNPTDGEYDAFGLVPPSAGYDFFQGPIVKSDDPNDEAVFDLKYRKGYKNLPMTSFGYFAAGADISDPGMGKIEFTWQWYNMLNGYIPTNDLVNPTSYTHGSGPNAGEATKFPLDGDPVTDREGIVSDIDGKGTNLAPGDRRMFAATGPFTMAAGDTQEVVVALVAETGSDNISSIAAMKEIDVLAQKLYDDLFSSVPKPPAGPNVAVSTMEDGIVLNWGEDQEALAKTEADNPLTGYNFEGYNVYQLPSATASLAEATRLATYDKVNGVGVVMGKRFKPEYGQVVEIPVQYGQDKGVQRYFHVTRNYITGEPLYKGNTYYFAITAYNYNGEPKLIEDKALESGALVMSITHQSIKSGETLAGAAGDKLGTVHDGVAEASVEVTVVDPKQLTGDDYEVYFNLQHYYMDIDGQWKFTNYADSVGKGLAKAGDLTGTSLSAIAYTSPNVGTRDLKFVLDLVAADYDYSDGVKLTFPAGIVINSAEDAEGNAHGVFHPVIDAATNSVLWGGADTTGDGGFSGGEVFTVNVNTPALPLDVDFIVYDDGWATGYGAPYDALGNGIVHAVGTTTITEEGYAFKTENHWNLRNLATGDDLAEDINTLQNTDMTKAVIVDGLQFAVKGSYEAPTDFIGVGGAVEFEGSGSYDFTSYGYQGWSGGEGTARSIDAFGNGTTDMMELIKDYEFRFTGEYADPISVAGLTYHPIKEGTGSLATLYLARNGYSLADHPENPNPGTDAPFLVRIPFEVWNVTDNVQVNLIMVDRLQDMSAGSDMYAFNPIDRMYIDILNTPYDESAPNSGDPANSDTDELTWNLVCWETDWQQGDVVKINYSNPIMPGVDKFTVSTKDLGLSYAAANAQEDVENVNVFPNPYYASNSLEPDRFNRFVTFTHLPQKATFRIFNLAGVQVRKLEKDDDTQFFRWDLQNESQLPVGSGMYIVHIDMKELGKTKILKLMVIQGEQILEYY